LFCTVRSKIHRPQIECLSFEKWADANAAERFELGLAEKIPEKVRGKDKYLCAPQVFYYRPHEKWYLIYQMVINAGGEDKMVPGYSTSEEIAEPKSWTQPTALCAEFVKWDKRGLDFWVICDEEKAYLFYTSLNGLMWRSQIKLEQFPSGNWTEPKVVLQGDIFEASHTYRLKGLDKYLTIIEAVGDKGRRYQKAYVAETLDGVWLPLADSEERPFAGMANVADAAEHWTDSISHGEMLRAGFDEHLEIEPDNLRYLFQGAADKQRAGIDYGRIPWRLGILEQAQ